MWVIASIPLWIMGFCSFVIGCFGMYRVVSRLGAITEKDPSMLWGAVILWLIATVVLILAAKVAS